MYHGGMRLGLLSCNHTIPSVTSQTVFMLAVTDKNLLVVSCSEAELHLHPLADIHVCKLLRCSSMSHGKKCYGKCMGAIVQNQS